MFHISLQSTNKQKTQLTVDWRIVSLVLVFALMACVFIWKPWRTTPSSSRTITVSGESTVKATPDEYQMSPHFEFTGDRTKATSDANAMATQVTAKLKELGVKDTEIKSSTSDYNAYNYTTNDTTQNTLQLSYTITVTNKDVAQKVQDYFLNTEAKGQISPYATFSEAKQKQLEAQARSNAIDDAKAKAEKSAEQVGSKLGKVKSITDDNAGGVIRPMLDTSVNSSVAGTSGNASIPVQSGQNDFSASVKIEYELH